MKVVITEEKAREIEKHTRNQADNEQLRIERRRMITASRIGRIAKMKNTTKDVKNGGSTIHAVVVEGKRPHIMARQRKQNEDNSISLTRGRMVILT